VTGMTINFESVNEDSAKILDEAQTIAESRMKDTFPELPGGQSKVGTGLGDRV
jgi:division protein CdvB (Snf7/Vps24/ESCRT-III family)